MATNNKGINPLAAAVVGAAVGAAAVALSDKDNRDKLAKKYDQVKDKGMSAYHDISRQANKIKRDITKKADHTKKLTSRDAAQS